MNQIYRITKFLVTTFVLTVLLLVAAYCGAGRYLLSKVPEYQKEIEVEFSQALGMPITIENMSSAWVGFDPILKLSELAVGESKSIFLGQANIRLSFVRSLLALEPRFHSIELYRPYMSLKQGKQGSWNIEGIEMMSEDEAGDGSDLQVLSRYLDNAQINLHSGAVHINARDLSESNWVLPLLSISYHQDHIYASGEILQPGGNKPLFNFALEGHGVLSRESIIGQLYVEARSLDMFNDYIQAYEWNGLTIKDVEATGRAWIGFANQSIKSVQADLQVKNVYWQANQVDQIPLTNLATSAKWVANDERSHLELRGLGFSWAGKRWDGSDVVVNHSNKTTNIQVSTIDIGLVSDFAVVTGLLPDRLHQRLETTTPDGELSNLHIDIKNEELVDDPQENSFVLASTSESDFMLQGNLKNLKTGALDGAPGGSGIDGYIEAGEAEGLVLLDSHRFTMDFPNLFLEPWRFSKAEGAIAWQVDGNETRILSDGIRLHFADGSLVYGDFLATINPPHREDILDLRIAMQDVEFENVTDFVPYHAVGKGLYSWLDKSLVGGLVSEGLYLGFGSTEKKTKPNSFTSSVRVYAQEGVLKYDEAWPTLDKLTAQIDVQESKVDIVADYAEIEGMELEDLRAHLPYVVASEPISPPVEISAKAKPSKAQMDYWFYESPISGTTATIAEQIEIQGDVEFDLDLFVGTGSDAQVDYKVTAQLQKNDIEHRSLNIPFKETSGEIVVSSAWGVEANSLETSVLGQPAEVNIYTSPESQFQAQKEQVSFTPEFEPEARFTYIALKSQSTLQNVLNHFEIDPITGLSGEFSYTAALKFPYENPTEEEIPPRIHIQSDMIGLRQDWPEPFNKGAQVAQNLDIGIDILPDQLNVSVDASSLNSPRVKSLLQFKDETFLSGKLEVGAAGVAELPESGLNIAGVLPRGNIEPWIEFLSGTGEEATSGGNDLVNRVDLQLGTLQGYGQDFGEVDLSFTSSEGRWQAEADGPMLVGLVRLPKGNAVTEFDFETFSISVPETNEDGSVADDADNEFDPRALPGLLFETDKLVVDGNSYGSWKTQLEPTEEGIVFRDLLGKLAGTEIAGQVTWNESEEGAHTTIATGKIKGKNFSKFMQVFDGPTMLESKSFKSDLALVWPDNPVQFDGKKLSGKLSLDLKDGVFKKANQADALKLFGVFNAEAITRRLSLDFSDLYESGVAYDDIAIAASLDQGLLTLSKPLSVKGPSSNYKITGRTNLESEILDMNMEVSFPVAQNVPLAALMLGAPQVGGAVWLVDKVLGEPLSSITNAKYEITGTWEKPKVQVKDVFNAAKINDTLQGKSKK